MIRKCWELGFLWLGLTLLATAGMARTSQMDSGQLQNDSTITNFDFSSEAPSFDIDDLRPPRIRPDWAKRLEQAGLTLLGDNSLAEYDDGHLTFMVFPSFGEHDRGPKTVFLNIQFFLRENGMAQRDLAGASLAAGHDLASLLRNNRSFAVALAYLGAQNRLQKGTFDAAALAAIDWIPWETVPINHAGMSLDGSRKFSDCEQDVMCHSSPPVTIFTKPAKGTSSLVASRGEYLMADGPNRRYRTYAAISIRVSFDKPPAAEPSDARATETQSEATFPDPVLVSGKAIRFALPESVTFYGQVTGRRGHLPPNLPVATDMNMIILHPASVDSGTGRGFIEIAEMTRDSGVSISGWVYFVRRTTGHNALGDAIPVFVFDGLAPPNPPEVAEPRPNQESGLATPPGSRPALIIDDSIKPPVLQHRVEPVYPERARKARSQGIVVLKAIINADGSVGTIAVQQSLNRLLDAEAIRAVSEWTYQPATKNGVPVSVYLTVTVNFKLRS